MSEGNENPVELEEKLERRKTVKCVSNFFALSAWVDVLASVPLLILLFRGEKLSDISSVIGALQIGCFLVISVISSTLLLQTSTSYHDRIDAIGGWIVVQFIHLIGNCTLVVFELWPDPSTLVNKHVILISLIAWKGLFVLIEIAGMIYCFYIVHNPIKLIEVRPRHPLFNENYNEVASTAQTNQAFMSDHVDAMYNQGRPTVISYPPEMNTPLRNRAQNPTHYDSYLSLSNNTLEPSSQVHGPSRWNPAYNSTANIDEMSNPYADFNSQSNTRERPYYASRPAKVAPPPYTPSYR